MSDIRERTSEAASQASDAGRDLAHEARERAGDVAHEAGARARDLLGDARSGLSSQAASQQERLAAGLHHLGTELSDMGDASDDPGYATGLARQGADAARRLGDWFDQREPGDVLQEVQDFARRRPGAFLAIAAGAGLIVGRLLRGAKDASASSSGDSSRGAAQGPTAPAVPPAPTLPPAPPTRTSIRAATREPASPGPSSVPGSPDREEPSTPPTTPGHPTSPGPSSVPPDKTPDKRPDERPDSTMIDRTVPDRTVPDRTVPDRTVPGGGGDGYGS